MTPTNSAQKTLIERLEDPDLYVDADFIAKEDAEFKAMLDHAIPPTPKDEPGDVCPECGTPWKGISSVAYGSKVCDSCF